MNRAEFFYNFFNTSEFEWRTEWWEQARLECSVVVTKNSQHTATPYIDTDPRNDPNWGNDDWDDVYIPQWYRFVYRQYEYIYLQKKFRELFE